MIIRRAVKSDADELVPLFTALHEFHVAGKPDIFVSELNPFDRKFIRKLICGKNKVMFVSEEDESIIGFCAATLFPSAYQSLISSLFIDYMYVSPENRRKGVATALFLEAKKFAAESKCQKLDLAVWSFNSEAIEFYASLGMSEQRRYLETDL